MENTTSREGTMYGDDNTQVTSVWSAYGHKFISDGDGYESCLTCGAQYQLLAHADDPTCGDYLASNGDQPIDCTHDTSMNHGYEDGDPRCNCVQCS